MYKHAGKIRDYDFTKKEWVLEYDTVHYLNWEDLQRALNYDIEQERGFSYKGISTDELIAHITSFVSGIWQVHAFCEGNTRTTAVFTILYLRDLGFKVNNDMFANHSWYFRNALVRAKYRNAVKGIDYSPIYLERFFRNLLLDEQWDLRNRYLHINPSPEWSVQPNLADLTSTNLAPDKHPTSTRQVTYGQSSNHQVNFGDRQSAIIGERNACNSRFKRSGKLHESLPFAGNKGRICVYAISGLAPSLQAEVSAYSKGTGIPEWTRKITPIPLKYPAT